MNRIEFMKELEMLLASISESERTAAMQYYNDYFDDAGVENEMHIISELGSPAKVAGIIKGSYGNNEKSSEYSETGYTDTRFGSKEEMMKNGTYRNAQNREQYKNRSKSWLWIAFLICVAPIVLPVLLGLLMALAGVLVALFAAMISIVIAAVSIVIAGIAVFIAGCTQLGIFLPLGLALIGAGLIITVVGLIATAFSGKVCVIVIPCVVRGFIALCRKPFHRKVVSA